MLFSVIMTHMSDNLILPDDSRPTRSDAVKNHALLLETAQRLFKEHGVEAVSMTAIAEAAGVGKGTLYRHFENKAVLTHVLLDEDMRDLQTRSLRRLQQEGDPLDDLHWFLEQVVRFVDRNEELLCAASECGRGQPAELSRASVVAANDSRLVVPHGFRARHRPRLPRRCTVCHD